MREEASGERVEPRDPCQIVCWRNRWHVYGCASDVACCNRLIGNARRFKQEQSYRIAEIPTSNWVKSIRLRVTLFSTGSSGFVSLNVLLVLKLRSNGNIMRTRKLLSYLP